MATGRQLKAAILARRAKGPRKKRTRPKPRQYTIADLERPRDRVAAAERRIDNDRTNNPNRGRAGLERAQLELSVIESQLCLRGRRRAMVASYFFTVAIAFLAVIYLIDIIATYLLIPEKQGVP